MIRRARPRSDHGYTLLELLIVWVLVTVLMAGVWSLLRNWSGLYERGEQRVQHMQLVRSLCDQFTDDVHAAAQVAPPARAADPAGPHRRTASSRRVRPARPPRGTGGRHRLADARSDPAGESLAGPRCERATRSRTVRTRPMTVGHAWS